MREKFGCLIGLEGAQMVYKSHQVGRPKWARESGEFII
jgi:hypothetical protein